MVGKTRSLLDYTDNAVTTNAPPAVGDYSWVNKNTPLDSLNLNWKERELPERLRTKHVHRLHPYLGKYVPQLVEILLRKFNPKVVCDPFSGSGTTLVEANTLGIDSIGCDISEFNCLLAKVKTDKYDLPRLERELKDILKRTVSALNEGDKSEKLMKDEESEYLKQWFHKRALGQLLVYRDMLQDYHYHDVMKIILSRSARSARLTRHFDLDFPRKPQTESYYCHKHSRTCTPTDDALAFLTRYTHDTIARIREFSEIRTDASVKVICGNSKTVEFPECDAIMTSPPYVGLIDYHEQHRYAYELLGLPDRRDLEIGAAVNGFSKKAKEDYMKGIQEVFANVRKNMSKNGIAIVVVHDKSDLYSEIAINAGFEVKHALTRHVNRRTGRRASEFFEQIFVWQTA